MQATMEVQELRSPNKYQQHLLKDKQVKDLIVDKRRLVEVPKYSHAGRHHKNSDGQQDDGSCFLNYRALSESLSLDSALTQALWIAWKCSAKAYTEPCRSLKLSCHTRSRTNNCKQSQTIVFGVTNKAKVMDVIKSMRTASLNAVPIVESPDIIEDHTQLVNPLLKLEVLDFLKMLSGSPSYEHTGLRCSWREQVTCHPESSLGEVVEKVV
ncbi:hypothetical protein HAX54_002712 [Datura stramonium]|uniref:Uncharacterized protein n=1 Tax=Datura stramonium TaxID=4076 RepID=A0ABS8RT46_DATST|nr:hypothetical protein [Datura stramonium]